MDDPPFEVTGDNADAPFVLMAYRGEGMALLAMDWRGGEPPDDLVGFAIEYKEPKGDRFYTVGNRLTFEGTKGDDDPTAKSSMRAPIQKFRWVHFPRNAHLKGGFTYRVTPVFMNAKDELSFGESQRAVLHLAAETYPGVLNVTFTRGLVSSQAFVDRFTTGRTTSAINKEMATLLPTTASKGLAFTPTHPDAQEALTWMGFEARQQILEVLDDAIADPSATVRVIGYDLNLPEMVDRFEKLGPRLRIIIDDSVSKPGDDGPAEPTEPAKKKEPDHGDPGSSESKAATRLRRSAGRGNVRRQHLGSLQHNKTIVVQGDKGDVAVCGSTNFSWRGFYVQNNNALVLHGTAPVAHLASAFDHYWTSKDDVAAFAATDSARWAGLELGVVDAQLTSSPHNVHNSALKGIGDDIRTVQSNLFYALAFLYQVGPTSPIRSAITEITNDDKAFVFGISDHAVDRIDVQTPDGNVAPVFPAALGANTKPFNQEPTGGGGARLHHKFVVIDFDKPSARVYLGSYNFSGAADTSNGENLVVIKDRRVAVSYMIEALRIFDHYQFRLVQAAPGADTRLFLKRPPRAPGEVPWWKRSYTDRRRIRDRQLFAGTG